MMDNQERKMVEYPYQSYVGDVIFGHWEKANALRVLYCTNSLLEVIRWEDFHHYRTCQCNELSVVCTR